ncbi:MAG: iron ABC transporter permease [Pseudomonadota bacterium]|nr:iron ABC transporter permease [Pseudomonadota bacterium]
MTSRTASYALLLALTALLGLAALGIGAGSVGVGDSLGWVLQGMSSSDAHTAMVLGDLRLPRVLKAVVIGAALGAAGVLLQAVTRNPLAETGLLGVNSGAALGVASGIALYGGLTPALQMGCALVGALAGSLFALLLTHTGRGGASPLRLVLAGLAIGATCQSVTAWLSLASSANLDQFRFWLLGSLAHPHAGLLGPGFALIGMGLLLAVALLRPLAALTLGDALASSLGHRPQVIRITAVVAVALLAGSAVALAGPIAFLGLIAPYAARAIAGVAVSTQLAYAMPLGAALLLAADLAARLIVAPFEAPVSALLALLGAPLLIVMVRRNATLALVHGAAPP